MALFCSNMKIQGPSSYCPSQFSDEFMDLPGLPTKSTHQKKKWLDQAGEKRRQVSSAFFYKRNLQATTHISHKKTHQPFHKTLNIYKSADFSSFSFSFSVQWLLLLHQNHSLELPEVMGRWVPFCRRIFANALLQPSIF